MKEEPGSGTRVTTRREKTGPRKGKRKAASSALSYCQTERGGKPFWDAEEVDRHLARGWNPRVPCEPLRKIETIMRTLRTRERNWWGNRTGREALRHFQHLHSLGMEQLSAHPSMTSSTPITPEEWSGTDDEWMEQNADLARLAGRSAIPLTLLPKFAGTATADAGCIDHAQASIGFSASLVRH